ncbi:hypothetical protein [Rhizobium leguminosarum]|uniref:hypothetical protein n=1 Tax=Rhizobium leguminosarum TaxID=384 RepID=UPI0015BDAC4E|nr:hypothetical protein [Rhizobium leguminosarum]
MGLIPMQYFKALLRSPILEAIISRNEFQVSTNAVASDDLRTVAEWMAYYSIIVGLSSADGLSIGVRTPQGVERLGVATGSSPSEEMEGEYTLRLLKALRALRSEASHADRAVKLDHVYLMGSCILSAQNSILGNFRDDVTFDVAKPADDTVPEEVQVVFISGFILGVEHYVYCSTCSMRSSVVDDRLIFTQTRPLHFLEAQLLSDFEADLERYQKKMMRVSRSNVCVTYLTEGTHETETTEIEGGLDGSLPDTQGLAGA